MKLVLAEKPSVAQSIAKVLGANKREDGYLEGGGYVVSWCVGHLVELAEPESYDEKYGKWSYNDLPIFPTAWKYNVSSGTKKQFGILKKLMARNDIDSLVCATDAGREGELIFRLVYHKAGCKNGYKKGEKKNTIIVDDETAIIVKRMFKMASEGMTITEIALALNKEGIPTPSQYMAQYRSSKYKVYSDWTWNSVKNIIENRIYTGDTEPFKSHVIKIGSARTKQIPRELREIIPETHEAIVSRELYYLAQTTIKSVSKKKGTSQNNPLTSRLICGCCGNTLGKGKAQNKNWLCSKARYNDNLDCKAVRVNEAEIKGVILRAIQQQCSLTDVSIQEQKNLQKASRSEKVIISDGIRSLQRKLDKLQNTKRELLEAVMADKLSRDDYVAKKKGVLAEEEAMTAKLAVLQQRLNELSLSDAKLEKRQEAAREIRRFEGISELTPEVMKALVKRVIIYPDKHIRIEWNFSDNLIPFAPKTN